QKHNSEICFIGETTLDNGITFGINVQLEANTSGDQIDESYLYVESDSLGQLLLGDTDSAAYLLHVTAPDGGISVDSGDLVNNEFFVNPGLDLFDRAVATTYLVFGDDDSGKISYITPRFAGIQIGLSYIPQFEAGGDNNSSLKLRPGSGNSNNINNGFAGAINYTEDFNGFGVQLSAGYMFGETGADDVTGGDDNLNAYAFGAQFGYGGFSFGGAYSRGEGDNGFGSRFNSRAWIVGATYEVGPYAIGVNYMKGEENPTGNAGKGRLDQAALSGTYRLGPGVRLVGAVFAFDGENEDNSEENDGWGGVVGLKLGF
ncbi:MAG: porin, partial [Rhodospirillales bacterium]